ncbi:MAG: hypothetical protein IJ147_03940 [Lachnospiraceae bacterium]|nr:hypothetical protein [Lachnospiraceae bacterium]
MTEVIQNMNGFAIIILTIVIWIIYNACFTRFYFGTNVIGAIISELFGCLLVAMILWGLLGVIVQHILAFVGGVIAFLLKAMGIISIGLCIIFIVYFVVVCIKQKKATSQSISDTIRAVSQNDMIVSKVLKNKILLIGVPIVAVLGFIFLK